MKARKWVARRSAEARPSASPRLLRRGVIDGHSTAADTRFNYLAPNPRLKGKHAFQMGECS